jgi:hypothetical protein
MALIPTQADCRDDVVGDAEIVCRDFQELRGALSAETDSEDRNTLSRAYASLADRSGWS